MTNRDTKKKLSYGLIPSAGKGSRAYPYTADSHKCMLDINGKPNILRIIELMRDELEINEIVIIIGYMGDSIRDYFGDGSDFNVTLHYVENTELDKGLAWSVLLAQNFINDYFCIMLCDESYIRSNHSQLLTFPFKDALFTCAGLHVDYVELIKQNYAIEYNGDNLVSLHEKPKIIINDIMGSGTFISSPDIFEYLQEAFKATSDYVDFVSFLNDLLQCHPGKLFLLHGSYVNINNRDSIHLAKYHDRDRCFDQYKKALLILSEGDEENISFTIERYRKIQVFDRIFIAVPHENSISTVLSDEDIELIVCPENCFLYGEKQHYAIQQIDQDIIVTVEADYSFANRDVFKLLTYLRDADVVIGTRTTRQLIEQGSDMRGSVRFAQLFLGKLIELLWWSREARFTDVGCTFKILWRSSYRQIMNEITHPGVEYCAEFLIACLEKRLRVIEVPVNYFNRSTSLNRAYRKSSSFLSILKLIFKKRIQTLI